MPVDEPPAASAPEAVPDAGVPDDDDEPDDVAPDDEPELPGVVAFELGGVTGLVDGVVVGGPPGVVDGVDGGDVVVEEPLGVVVSGFVVVDPDGAEGDVGAGLDGWPPPTSPPTDVVAPAGLEPPTIPDNGFFARASTAVTVPIDRPNTTAVAMAMLRHRRDRAASSVAAQSPSILARPPPPCDAPAGAGTGPGAVGGGPRRPGGGTSREEPDDGTSLVLSGSLPSPWSPSPQSTLGPDAEPPEMRAPLPTSVRTVVLDCLSASGIVPRMARLVERIQWAYTSLPTLAAALMTPAPMSVPATPKNDASTAAVTEASALATTWTGLRWIERSRSFMVTVEGVAPGSQLYTALAKYIYR